jgi:hypothetical protein
MNIGEKKSQYLVKVSVSQVWELILDRLQQIHSDLKTGIGAVGKFLTVPDCSQRTSCLCLLIISA